MSIHVREIEYNRRKEYMLYYPGMTRDQAQSVADRINGGYLLDEDRLRQLKAKREPLSDEDLRSTWEKEAHNPENESLIYKIIPSFARAIEAAHGITGEQE